jgi:hypothetical protein
MWRSGIQGRHARCLGLKAQHLTANPLYITTIFQDTPLANTRNISCHNSKMFSKSLRTTVLQASALYCLMLIVNYHMLEIAFDPVMKNDGYLNMTNAINMTAANTALTDKALDQSLTSAANRKVDDGIGINRTATTSPPESFYTQTLPMKLVIFFLLAPLQYWWLIWLERILPARPKRRDASHQQSTNIGDNEDREEEIVKKWIARGMVRRASLNWCNTFLKWVLDMTVGSVLYYTLEYALRTIIKLDSPTVILEKLPGVRYHFVRPSLHC